jgi:hypothetical protein
MLHKFVTAMLHIGILHLHPLKSLSTPDTNERIRGLYHVGNVAMANAEILKKGAHSTPRKRGTPLI